MMQQVMIPGGWVASLSDGSTVRETMPEVGELTPWRRLLQRCKDETHIIKKGDKDVTVPLRITGLSLRFGEIEVIAMPHKMCDGFFQAREIHQSMFRQAVVHRQGIGSVIGDQVFITWFEFTDGQYLIRAEVRPLDVCKVHTDID